MHPVVERRQEAIRQVCSRHRLRWLDACGWTPCAEPGGEPGWVGFLVELDDLEPAEFAETYFSLTEALEALLAHRVELIVESAVTNPHLSELLNASRLRLYGT